MTLKRTILLFAAAILCASAVFWVVQRELSSVWLRFALHPEIREAIEQSMDDQKRLREAEPDSADRLRRRFESLRILRQRLEVLELSREAMLRRYTTIVVAAFAGILLATGALWVLLARREAARLERIQSALTELSLGATEVRVGDRGGGAIGKIAGMIEDSARTIARQRKRIESLGHLQSWQESARRHAHEIRTPLTAARMELERLADLAAAGPDPAQAEQLRRSGIEEIERLARFTREFSSFAGLPAPQLAETDLVEVAREFAATFAGAWPGVSIEADLPEALLVVAADPALLRQVLSNLTDNSARAGAARVRISAGSDESDAWLAHEDDGPGIDAAVRPRLFEPYATTSRIGEGLGLGLAISRKVLLDHGGDLELVHSGASGSAFRLRIPRSTKPTP